MYIMLKDIFDCLRVCTVGSTHPDVGTEVGFIRLAKQGTARYILTFAVHTEPVTYHVVCVDMLDCTIEWKVYPINKCACANKWNVEPGAIVGNNLVELEKVLNALRNNLLVHDLRIMDIFGTNTTGQNGLSIKIKYRVAQDKSKVSFEMRSFDVKKTDTFDIRMVI